MAKDKSKKKGKWGWIILAILVIGAIVPENDEEKEKTQTNSEELNEETHVEESTEQLSDMELFCVDLDSASDYVNYETAENLYNLLHDELLFENIIFKQKNAVGDILFDVNADNYSLMISVDNDGIYSVRCGSYDLYDGESIIITKNGLDDRSIDNESEYYVIAQEIVSNNLKSPKTAVFPSLWSDEVKMQRNGDMVIVQSYVDAQNSFGAIIRSQWQVEFKVIDLNSFSYEIIYINIDGTTAGEFIKLD